MSTLITYNVYAPDAGEKIYAKPIYEDVSGRKPIDIVGFNNWHAALGYKYMGKHLYDETYTNNRWPGWESNSGFDAKDWNGNYYISGKNIIDYPLVLKKPGDLVDTENIFESINSEDENETQPLRGDNLACVFTDFYNCPYYDYYPGTKDVIKKGIDACVALAKQKNPNEKILAYPEKNSSNNEEDSPDVADNERKNIEDILNAIGRIDRTLCFNLVQDQNLSL